MIREYLRTAWQSFSGNKLRAGLSLVGVVIGVASVVAVAALSSSGAADVRRQFEAFGLDAVQVFPNWRADGRPLPLDDALASRILRELPDAAAVLRKAQLGSGLGNGRRRSESSLVAVDPRYFLYMGAGLDQGRSLDATDEYRARPVAVIGAKAALDLFPEGEPLGKTIQASIGDSVATLTVVGVLAEKSSMFMDDWDRSAYIAFGAAAKRYVGGLEPQGLSVVARDRSKVVSLAAELERFFLERTGDPEAFWVDSPKRWAEENEKMIRSLSLLLGGVAGISLVVGCIGIMNIMLASVSERTREIGVRKAVGATRREIAAQFIVETSALTLAGGAIGLALGFLAARLAVKAFGWDFVASPGAAALALGVSVAVGLAAGVYPAIRASRLDPIVALAAE
ncbi:MAG: ABC transporter permease [Spirochaetes bacterium]|nr:ABC transporter permease [Spirochaetota bacterium]MBU1081281.1 ABC transporter permease [Spirochaetota bacterium]